MRAETCDQKTTKKPAHLQPATSHLQFGRNGILIPPRDPEALADAMRFFIDHPEQIEIMGRESRRYAEEHYDVHKVNAVMLREMGLGE